MTDQSRIAFIDFDGTVGAVVQIKIDRTIIIDADKLAPAVQACLSDESHSYQDIAHSITNAHQMAPTERRFYAEPWTEAKNRQLNLQTLSKLIALTESKSYFRLEGSAQAGFIGYLTFSGVDRPIDLSKGKLAAATAVVAEVTKKCDEDKQSGVVTELEHAAIIAVCVDITKNIALCEAGYKSLQAAQDALDKQEREAKQRECEKHNNEADGHAGEHEGRASLGDRFSGFAIP